jgi:hydrogenase expression/formation protein HypE
MGSEKSITMAHGSGGRLAHELLNRLVVDKLSNPLLDPLTDSASLSLGGTPVAFTTDSYVVKPLFFPGGDIGKLGVCGTINDLAVMGAKPLYLSLALIIEEGLPEETLARVIDSIRESSRAEGVEVVTGDTKVVEKDSGDQLFLNTAGIGVSIRESLLAPGSIKAGDLVVLSGSIGDHGIAVMSEREGLTFETTVVSDCASVYPLVEKLLQERRDVKFLRDPTRGGLATTLNEICSDTGLGIRIEENSIPIKEPVLAACELLGLDPLYVANEGKLVAVIGKDDAARAVDLMRELPVGAEAGIIGEIVTGVSRVELHTAVGGARVVDMLTGEHLPRIC